MLFNFTEAGIYAGHETQSTNKINKERIAQIRRMSLPNYRAAQERLQQQNSAISASKHNMDSEVRISF